MCPKCHHSPSSIERCILNIPIGDKSLEVTDRQAQIYTWVRGDGHTAAQVAEWMDISLRTVRRSIKSVDDKLAALGLERVAAAPVGRLPNVLTNIDMDKVVPMSVL